jgi:hypothetical protein
MNAVFLAFALAAQSQQPAPEQPPLRAEGPPSRELSPAHDLYDQNSDSAPPPARAAMQRFGACVAERSGERAAALLGSDFTTHAYRSGLQVLARVNGDCFRQRRGSRMRSSDLLLAGAIAEHLVERGAEPVNVRLARAALQPATPAYSVADQIAICVVRSVPDDVAHLFATEVGSDEEGAAVRAIAPVVGLCSQNAAPLNASEGGLRAILATAAFRSIQNGGATTAARN